MSNQNDRASRPPVEVFNGVPVLPVHLILDDVKLVLSDRGSDLVVEGRLDDEFVRQSTSILTEAASILLVRPGDDLPTAPVNYAAAADLIRTGQLRAQQNAHPGESMMAGEVLFDSALPTFVEWTKLLPHMPTVVRVAQVLHHAIWRRFPLGAAAYAETLRLRLSIANQESRLQVSRDLHDRVAHGIAAALQRIELSTVGPSAPHPHLASATEVLRRTLDDVQNIALDLRQLVGDRDLGRAISDYAADTSALKPAIVVSITGSPKHLLPSIAEEAFMIVLEAIRNARTHANGTEIRVQVAWGTDFVVDVSDDGVGIDRDRVRTDSIGLLAMRERADAIGAQLSILSGAGRGTTVSLAIPIEGSVAL